MRVGGDEWAGGKIPVRGERREKEGCHANGHQRLGISLYFFLSVAANRLTERRSLRFDWGEQHQRGRMFLKLSRKKASLHHSSCAGDELLIALVYIQ